jgi:hypothetical protein
MAETVTLQSQKLEAGIPLGFISGFFATLVFHQLALLALHDLGLTSALPYAMKPVPPFGVPQFISLAFWGGVWGIVLDLVERQTARGPIGYWIGAIVFGAIFPTLVAWFVVLPRKGLPAGHGFHYPGVLVGPIVNGLWGLGTALFLSLRPGAVVPAR